MDGVLDQLNATFGDKTPIVVAVFVGVFSLAILGCCLGLFGSSGGKKNNRTESEDVKEREENHDGEEKVKKPKGKGTGKAKQTSKKVTLPSHPLLAGEFKGHTGAVLSIDMESNGKYLASCSEGIPYPCLFIVSIQYSIIHRNNKNDLAYLVDVHLSLDRTLRLWHMKTLKEKEHK